VSVNRAMALRVAWGTRVDDHTPAADARELLEMCGLIEPGGHEILPDDTTTYSVGFGTTIPGTKSANPTSPLAFADHGRRPEGMTTPPGLAALPPLPAAPAKKKTKKSAPKPAATSQPPARGQGDPEKPRTPAQAETSLPRRRGPKPAPREHGTLRGYRQHISNREPRCRPCKDAYNARPCTDTRRTVRAQQFAVDLDVWFAEAQRSPDRAVQRACAVAVSAFMALRIAMDDLARAETRNLRRADTRCERKDE
jgi:hypothetical protein